MTAVHLSPSDRRYEILAEDAMRMVDEGPGLVAARLAHGDELFGWQTSDRLVGFGWVTFRERSVGPTRLNEAPGRAFLYNFHTAEAYRGRGLYPALLLLIRHVLGRAGWSDFVIDVDVQNGASLSGVARGGFAPAARTTYVTLFCRFNLQTAKTALHAAAVGLL